MKHLRWLAFSCGATLLLASTAFAQDTPVALPRSSVLAAKPADNAAMAAIFKNVKVAGEAMPDPRRPAGGNTNTPHPIQNFVAVTDAMLRDPDPSNWMMLRGNYQGWDFSRLEQINKANVKNLQMVWSRLMDPGINETTPLVYDGVMYLGNPNDVIQAIDAATGEVLWQYRRRLPSLEQMHNNPWGQRKRSVAIFDDKIYSVTKDNYLIALDARTGKELWQVNRGGDYYATNTSGPIVADGVVIAGTNCQNAPFPCWVDAYDAQTGKLLWRNELVPRPGDPGDETWKGKPYLERWATDTWGPLTYDPDANLVFYGSSGIGPASEKQRGQIGASLAGTDTRWAVNAKTGKIVWKHQVLPEDNWDQDCVFEMMVITTPVYPDPKAEGMFSIGRSVASSGRRTLTGMPCKTSVLWSFDELTGQYLWSKATVPQNLISKIDDKGLVYINQDKPLRDYDKTYNICPSWGGGRDWRYAAYSPQTNVMYIPMQNICSDMKVRVDSIPSLPSNSYNVSAVSTMASGKTNIGRIDAVNVETGRTLWSWETLASNDSPMLATASGLLFNSGLDRYVRAQDQADGKILWRTRLGSEVNGGPISYSVKGRQYIAIAAGGGSNNFTAAMLPTLDQPSGGNMIYVFSLPQ